MDSYIEDLHRRLEAKDRLIREYRRLADLVEGPLAIQFQATAKQYDGSTGIAEKRPDQWTKTS
jgi:hypothetical protein